MSAHPTDEALFAAATGADPSARAHARECAECGKRYARLSAGASLIAAARADTAPEVDWRAMDANVMAAAAATAADIRRGALRAPRRIGAPVYLGVALAVAAAGVFAFRAGFLSPRHDGGQNTAQSNGAREERNGSTERVPSSPVEGVVLMVASPAAYSASGESAAPLAGSTVVREGGRIAVDDHGGRAVFSLHAGYQLDVRPAGEVTFRRLRTDETTLVLSKGEVRIDGPDTRETRVALEVSGWTVIAKGGAFTASLEDDVVRVRVLRGKITVRRGDGAEREIDARDEIELAKESGAIRVVSRESRDPSDGDLSFLARDGRVVNIPRVPESAPVSILDGNMRLPRGVELVRVHGVTRFEARTATESWAWESDPNAPAAEPAWRSTTQRAQGIDVATGEIGGSGRRMPHVAVSAQRPAATPSPSPPALPVAPRPPEDIRAVRMVRDRIALRSGACFRRCEMGVRCTSGDRVANVDIELDQDARPATVTVTGLQSTELQTCLARELRSVPWPLSYANTTRRESITNTLVDPPAAPTAPPAPPAGRTGATTSGSPRR